MDRNQGAVVEAVLANLLSDDRLSYYQAEIEFMGVGMDDTVILRLLQFYYGHVGEIAEEDLVDPVVDLAKCVHVDRFLMRYASDDVRTDYAFQPRDAYLQALRNNADRNDMLWRDLPSDPTQLLIPAMYSWLIPRHVLTGLQATDVATCLRLRNARAPLVLLGLPREALEAWGVRVRPPCAIDTIPTMDAYWEKGAVADELIDSDIVRGTVGEALCLD